MIREASESEVIIKQDHVYRALGAGALNHNVLCSVCHNNSAVWDLNSNVLEPCWDCQKVGWETKRRQPPHWITRLLGGLHNGCQRQ